MRVGDIQELRIATILDRGIPNKECVAIEVHQAINMGQFGVMLGQYAADSSALPFFDHMFWFGDGFVKSGDWLFLYTGTGNALKTPANNGINDIYSLYWGKRTTVFADSMIVPILFRVDAVDVLPPPDNLPQIGSPSG